MPRVRLTASTTKQFHFLEDLIRLLGFHRLERCEFQSVHLMTKLDIMVLATQLVVEISQTIVVGYIFVQLVNRTSCDCWTIALK